nr:hypothetical protein [Tanacetum cinerariifolium]
MGGDKVDSSSIDLDNQSASIDIIVSKIVRSMREYMEAIHVSKFGLQIYEVEHLSRKEAVVKIHKDFSQDYSGGFC